MAEVSTHRVEWTVLARPAGEVLAVRAGGSGLQLALAGCPRGVTASQVEGWLSELIGMASASTDSGSAGAASCLPLPRVLHQALTGLLFFQSELWGEPIERAPLALAVVESDGRVAFGWTGSGRVVLRIAGDSSEPVWTIVRDDHGREARAFVSDGRKPLSVEAVWLGTGPDGAVIEGALEARWPGLLEVPAPAVAAPEAVQFDQKRETAAPDPPEPGPVAPHADAGQSDNAPGAAHSRPFWHFRSWMDRLSNPGERRAGTSAPLAEPEPIAHDVPGVPDLLPEPETRAEPLAAEAPSVESVPIEAVPIEAVPIEAVPIEAVPIEAAPIETTPVEVTPAETTPVEVTPVEAAPVEAAPVEVTPVEPVAEVRGELAAEPAEPLAAVRPRTRRLEWPAPEDNAGPAYRPWWRRSWLLAAAVIVLFGVGWLFGRMDLSGAGRAVGSALKAVGLGPARYDVTVTSRPSGAWISVDGVDQARRTPASLQLAPGQHEIVLTISGEGGSSSRVAGKRGEHVNLDVVLFGGLKITAPPGSVPLSVTVDGLARGYLPVDVDRLQPGIHRLQFSGPGVAPWEQTVEVHVNRTAEVVAQPVVSPPTGVLEVRATLADESGSEPLTGATVWIDGQQRGATPLKLELPRGPHSIRVSYQGESGAVQVIELPGGNQRFATVELGMNADAPRLAATLSGRVPLDRPTVLSASLDRAREGDVREMWLHVRTPEGAWRRYPMTVMKATGGLVGVVVFPTVLFDAQGRTSWYVSALTPMGDEYFTEIQPAQVAIR